MSQAVKDALDALIGKIKPSDTSKFQPEIDAINAQLLTDEAASATVKQDLQDLTDEVQKALTQLTSGDAAAAAETLKAAV